MRQLFTLTILVFSVGQTQAFESCSYSPSNTPSKFPVDQHLDLKKMVDIAHQTGSLHKTLATFKQQYPEYQKFHLLNYCSSSLQEASFVEPRAIVFGPKAEFIYTFNGSKHHGGGNALETATIEKTTGAVSFREVAYRQEGEKWDDTLDEDEVDKNLSSKYVRVSKTNPKKCLLCHAVGQLNSERRIAVLNWQNYFLWACSYGSHDDFLTSQFQKKANGEAAKSVFTNFGYDLALSTTPKSQGRHFDIKEGFEDKEVSGFLSYLQKKDSHPRYSALPDRITDQAFRELLDGKPFNQIRYQDKFEEEKMRLGLVADGNSYTDWPERPNGYFQERVNTHNTRRVVNELSQTTGIKDLALSLHFIEKCGGEETPGISGPMSDKKHPKDIIRDAVPPGLLADIEAKIGTFEEFEKTFLERELDGQTARIYQFMNALGTPLTSKEIGPQSGNRPGGYWSSSAEDFYAKKLGRRQFSNAEKLAMTMESASLGPLIANAYLLKSLDFDIHDHSTPMTQGQRSAVVSSGSFLCAARDIYHKVYSKKDYHCSDLKRLINGKPAVDGISPAPTIIKEHSSKKVAY